MTLLAFCTSGSQLPLSELHAINWQQTLHFAAWEESVHFYHFVLGGRARTKHLWPTRAMRESQVCHPFQFFLATYGSLLTLWPRVCTVIAPLQFPFPRTDTASLKLWINFTTGPANRKWAVSICHFPKVHRGVLQTQIMEGVAILVCRPLLILVINQLSIEKGPGAGGVPARRSVITPITSGGFEYLLSRGESVWQFQTLSVKTVISQVEAEVDMHYETGTHTRHAKSN